MKKLLFIISFYSTLFGVDLEENTNDCIVELKRIEIPAFPDAFNPSLVRWQGRLLLSFRQIDTAAPLPFCAGKSLIGLQWLKGDFSLDGPSFNVNIPSLYNEDCRLI